MSVTKVIFLIVLVKSFDKVFGLVRLATEVVESGVDDPVVNDVAARLLSRLRSRLIQHPHIPEADERSPLLQSVDSEQISEVKITEVHKHEIGADLIAPINYYLKELFEGENYNFNVEAKDDGEKFEDDDDIVIDNYREVSGKGMSKVNPLISDYETRIDLENETAFDDTFWEPESRRIFKGLKSRIKDFPFMASISMFKQFQCAGSIIKDDLIITAASCLQLVHNNRFFRENPNFLSVRIGSVYTFVEGESIDVLEVYFYPGYNPRTLKHNIAIMRLGRKIIFKSKQKRVKRIKYDRHASPAPINGAITVVGWGATTISNRLPQQIHNILRYDELYPFDRKDCQSVYSKQLVTQKNFCAGYETKGGGACNHDVGGPGIYDSKLVGIISFGTPTCGQLNRPTVFTKVGYYADWIDKIRHQEVQSGYYRTTARDPFPFADLTIPTTDTPTTLGLLRPILYDGDGKEIYTSTTNAITTNNPTESTTANLSKIWDMFMDSSMYGRSRESHSSGSDDDSSSGGRSKTSGSSSSQTDEDYYSKEALRFEVISPAARPATTTGITKRTGVAKMNGMTKTELTTTPATTHRTKLKTVEVRQNTYMIKKQKIFVTKAKGAARTASIATTSSYVTDVPYIREGKPADEAVYDTVTVEIEKSYLRPGDEELDGMSIESFEDVARTQGSEIDVEVNNGQLKY